MLKICRPMDTAEEVNEAVQYWRKGTSESNQSIVSSKFQYRLVSRKMTSSAEYIYIYIYIYIYKVKDFKFLNRASSYKYGRRKNKMYNFLYQGFNSTRVSLKCFEQPTIHHQKRFTRIFMECYNTSIKQPGH